MIDLRCGDTRALLKAIPDASVQTCITSPPYFGLRDYGVDGQIGLEQTPDAYIAELVAVFREVRRVLKDDGTVWLNLGDSYASGGRKTRDPGQSKIHPAFAGEAYKDGLRPDDPPGVKPKDLIGIPWRVAFALQADGWYLRQDIIWAKPNPMPESVRDRCTKAHEYVFLLSKREKYYFDSDSLREPAAQAGRKRNDRMGGNKYAEGVKHSDGAMFTGSETRNRRSVWTVTPKPYRGAHFATFPLDLVTPMVLAGCPEGGTVLDPFSGAATTGLACQNTNRNYIGLELNPAYVTLAHTRLEAAKS